MSNEINDGRHHMNSLLMRESLLDRDLQEDTANATDTVRMLPEACVIKIGGGSIIDRGKSAVYPAVEALKRSLKNRKLIIGVGGGARTRHVFSVGLDLGLPTGALAQFAMPDALGNAHMLGALMAPEGVIAIPPEMFGHLLPLFLHSAPGVIFSAVPPYSIWEHLPAVGKIPPHRSDAGAYLLAECFGVKRCVYVKDVDGVYDKDPRENDDAEFFDRISTAEIRDRNIKSLPFDRIILDLLDCGRLCREIQVINGLVPERIEAALNGEHVGTIVYAE
jgi:molybdenum storage protein